MAPLLLAYHIMRIKYLIFKFSNQASLDQISHKTSMGIYINRLTLSLFFVLSASNHCLLLCEKYLARLIMVLSHRDRYFRLHFLMDMDSIGYVLLAFSLYLFLLDTLARLVFHKKYSLYSLFIYEYLVLWYINYYMLIFP